MINEPVIKAVKLQHTSYPTDARLGDQDYLVQPGSGRVSITNLERADDPDASASMENALAGIALGLVFMPVIGLAAGRQETVITSLPFTISSPGIYVLDSDLAVSGSDAIYVNTPDVVINLNGYSIVGSNGGFGVSAGQVANVIVENGRISGFATAVQLGSYSVAAIWWGVTMRGLVSRAPTVSFKIVSCRAPEIVRPMGLESG